VAEKKSSHDLEHLQAQIDDLQAAIAGREALEIENQILRKQLTEQGGVRRQTHEEAERRASEIIQKHRDRASDQRKGLDYQWIIVRRPAGIKNSKGKQFHYAKKLTVFTKNPSVAEARERYRVSNDTTSPNYELVFAAVGFDAKDEEVTKIEHDRKSVLAFA
jgi:hypothetical protein